MLFVGSIRIRRLLVGVSQGLVTNVPVLACCGIYLVSALYLCACASAKVPQERLVSMSRRYRLRGRVPRRSSSRNFPSETFGTLAGAPASLGTEHLTSRRHPEIHVIEKTSAAAGCSPADLRDSVGPWVLTWSGQASRSCTAMRHAPEIVPRPTGFKPAPQPRTFMLRVPWVAGPAWFRSDRRPRMSPGVDGSGDACSQFA